MTSLRNPGHLMRAGMNMLTTQVNSLRDYCGVTSGHPMPNNFTYQQQRLFHDLRHSPMIMPHMGRNPITTISEEDESNIESSSLLASFDPTPYVGHTLSTVPANASGIGRLNHADNSVLLALENFSRTPRNDLIHSESFIARGQMSGGIGTFHGHGDDQDDDLIDEPERLTIYGEQRPVN